MVQTANSGHPGAPMGLAPAAFALWNKVMSYNPKNYKWANRDRFVLSNGHACALLYSMLHLTGYPEWPLSELKSFRQLESNTAGHPEAIHPAIEVTTGPLGQGISSAVGLAIAEAHFAARYNKPNFKIIDHYTYVFCGDGCLQEGISSEASSLAGHLGLDKLIVIYDDNKITIDGETELSFTEDVNKRYESYGWHVQTVDNGDGDISGILTAIEKAKSIKGQPHFIKLRTTIGFGSAKQGKESVHGSPLGKDDLANVKSKFGFDPEQFFVIPDDVRNTLDHTEKGTHAENDWNSLFAEYKQQYPELASEFERRQNGTLPDGWEKLVPSEYKSDAQLATRKVSGDVLNALAKSLPDLMGGSADLNPSCFTYLNVDKDFQKNSYDQRNIRFGVREHAMCAILNGLAAYGGIIPFGSTFLNFIGYALGAVTLAALSELQMLFIMTHDSIGLGEDGPTHQPVEKFMICRETPNLLFIRPADGLETSASYIAALKSKKRPTVLALSRQNLPQLEGSSIEKALKGAYVLSDCEGTPDLILTASGSEVELIVNAQKQLNMKVRVVSFPSWELFEEQSQEYKESVFTPGVPVLSVEAGSTNGWAKYAHASLGMTTFGCSGPYKQVYKKFGLSVENIVEKSMKTVEFYKSHPVGHLVQRPF